MNMRELIQDPFYELIEKYNRCIIDYLIIKDDTMYQGEVSHKKALLFSMEKMNEREIETEPWTIDEEKISGVLVHPDSFFYVPEHRSKNHEKHVPYWYAFFCTPHNTGYNIEDFHQINEVLFPEGTAHLEIMEWTTNWSNYFDDGHEWWGTACFSVYDSYLNRYIVLLASTTD